MIIFSFTDHTPNRIENQLLEIRGHFIHFQGGNLKNFVTDPRDYEKIQNYEIDLGIRPNFLRSCGRRILALLDQAMSDIARYKEEQLRHNAEVERDIPDMPDWIRRMGRFEMPPPDIHSSHYVVPTAIPQEIMEATMLVEHLHINMKAYLELIQKYLRFLTRELESFREDFSKPKSFFAYLERLGVSPHLLTLIKVTRDCIHEHAPLIEVRHHRNGQTQFVAIYEKVLQQRSHFTGDGKLPEGSPGLSVDILESAKLAKYVAIDIPKLITIDCRDRLVAAGMKG